MRGDWIDLEAKVEVTDEMDRNPLKMRAEAGFDKKVDAEKSAGAAVEVSAGAAVEVRAAGAVKVSRRAKETRDDEKIDILTSYSNLFQYFGNPKRLLQSSFVFL